jgi:hypothetical protein
VWGDTCGKGRMNKGDEGEGMDFIHFINKIQQ